MARPKKLSPEEELAKAEREMTEHKKRVSELRKAVREAQAERERELAVERCRELEASGFDVDRLLAIGERLRDCEVRLSDGTVMSGVEFYMSLDRVATADGRLTGISYLEYLVGYCAKNLVSLG